MTVDPPAPAAGAVRLDDVLHGEVLPGIHDLDDAVESSAAATRVHDRGWHLFHVDGTTVVDKRSFLVAMASACGFPHWFGHNWDALADALADLSWAPAPGYVVLFDASGRYRRHADWSVVTGIFDEVVGRWAREMTPFFVLLR